MEDVILGYEPLTRQEKMLIADALNGCNTPFEVDPDYLRVMAGYPGHGSVRGCSGLEHEVQDALRVENLGEKWQGDGKRLLEKLSRMGAAQRADLIRAVVGVWSRNDSNFERDLEALEL